MGIRNSIRFDRKALVPVCQKPYSSLVKLVGTNCASHMKSSIEEFNTHSSLKLNVTTRARSFELNGNCVREAYNWSLWTRSLMSMMQKK